MSYAKFETNCMEKTIAFTSNEKFLSPVEQIYFQPINTQKIVEKGDEKQETFVKEKNPSTCKSCGS